MSRRFLFATTHLYPTTQHVVSASMRRTGERPIPPGRRTRTIQDAASELRRIPLPRTRVNCPLQPEGRLGAGFPTGPTDGREETVTVASGEGRQEEEVMIGLKRHTVRVVAHRAEWRVLFERERRALKERIGHLVVDVQH